MFTKTTILDYITLGHLTHLVKKAEAKAFNLTDLHALPDKWSYKSNVPKFLNYYSEKTKENPKLTLGKLLLKYV